MKKLVLLIPFLLVACKKEVTDQVKSNNSDSVLAVDQTSTPLPKDTLAIKDSLVANSKVVAKVLDEGVNRDVDKNEIVRTADGSMLPFTIGDQFTTDSQKFILKLKNVSKSQIKITVDTEKPMNIRINQIQKPDESLEGPFGRSLTLATPQKGEYWIILGKSNMADGSQKGHFSLKVE